MANTRPMNLSIPNLIADFLDTQKNKSAYVARLVQETEEFAFWMEKQ